MSRALLRPRNIAIAVGASLGAYYITSNYNPARTAGVKRIEDAYTKGGGTPTHLPAVATKLGDKDHITPPHETQGGGGGSGVSSKNFKENLADQKTAPQSAASKKFHEAMYGQDKGK
ncbi:hypothetical protein EJ05DRAFT_499685 [Pseudovirgaria hyperparasitica]|uniref:Uncharacterized protein n=1 Tax=Pseudovirgaria hyperparasitica TaxID=470096 RepID=A0A6A6WDT0_9PEZI|nr:uncharacterized protein EJ05DRAFT_499685 [Pseudovirgaria hyperparasitica]KAF2759271.1 hypothetical protein EJ05DRAFT_499685 [Pseudovirgaria hyperparasitica]